MDFCDSRGLHQLITFPTRQNAILDLVISEHTGTTQVLPNFNTSDHVAILVSFDAITTNVVYPSARCVFHWSQAPWNRLSHYFSSFNWDISGSVDDATSHVSSAITSAVEKFIPSCTPKLSRPTPWWNHHCETAWRRKMKFWHKCDFDNFHRACIAADHIYSTAIQNYKDMLRDQLQ